MRSQSKGSTMIWSDYLEQSRNWTFRLYTKEEVCEILKCSLSTFHKLRRLGLFKPLHRRVEYCEWRVGGTGKNYYTDRQVFEAITVMHDPNPTEIAYLAEQITEVPDNATYKERRKIKKGRTTQKDHRGGRRKVKLQGCIRTNGDAKWIEVPGAYTPRS